MDKKWLTRLISLTGILLATSVQADLIMTAPPRGTAEQDDLVFEPIAKYLSEKTGEKVTYLHQDDWEVYSAGMRHDKYDIVFDGPHFAAWRIKHLGHEALVKIPSDLGFVVVTWADKTNIKNLRSLRARKTCGLPSPNLGMVVFLAEFVATPPVVKEITGDMNSVYTAFKAHECDAMLLRDQFYFKKIKDEERARLKVVYTSHPLPNQTITVSKRVSPEMQALLRTNLLSKEGSTAAQKLLVQYSKEAPNFQLAENGIYDGVEKLLEEAVWGWK